MSVFLDIAFGFWLFLFNSRYREIWLFDFQKGNLLFKCIYILEAIISTIVGIGEFLFVIKLISDLSKS